MGKIFKFMGFTFLENALIQGIFTHAPPYSKLAPKFLLLHHRQKEIAHSPRQHSFKNLFPPVAERGGENYGLLYQNPIRKYEDDLEQIFHILYDLQFFQMSWLYNFVIIQYGINFISSPLKPW